MANPTNDRRLPPLLRRAWFGLNQTFRRLAGQAGITPDQFTVLRTLQEHAPDGLTQQQLAETITSDANTIASLLQRMELAGLVERRRDEEDRRALRLYLRPAGKGKFDEMRKVALRLQNRILTVLPQSRRTRFLIDLEAVANACQEETRQRKLNGRVSRSRETTASPSSRKSAGARAGRAGSARAG